MRVAFFGTPDFAVPSLRALVAADHEVGLVVTQPDRPAGRGYRLVPSPVKETAQTLALPVVQPESVSAPEFLGALRALAPEACVVVAFGQKITPELLSLAPFGWVNVHASLLPRWRGAAPVVRAILAGDEVTGVTTMYLDTGWDTGDMILRRRVAIDPEVDAGTLTARLAREGAALLVETMDQIQRGVAPRIPQPEAEATVAPRVRPEEGAIDWERSAGELHNLVRGLSPSPGAFTFWRGKRLKVRKARVAPDGAEKASAQGSCGPGAIIATGEGLVVACGAGALELLSVQLEGGKALGGGEFLRGQRPEAGERLGG